MFPLEPDASTSMYGEEAGESMGALWGWLGVRGKGAAEPIRQALTIYTLGIRMYTNPGPFQAARVQG